MPEPIDLRNLKRDALPELNPEHELPAPPEEPLLETESAAHPRGFEQAPLATPSLIAWEAPEFEVTADRERFLIPLGILLAGGGIAALIFKNFLFAVFLLIAGGLVAAQARRVPRTMRFAVTARGVAAGNRLYEFGDLKSFWISYDPPLFKELLVTSKKTLMPLVRVPLGDLDPLRLREILLRFLPEERHEESLIDIISKRLGF